MREQEKQGWDTRAWLVGILGGVICGAVADAVVYAPIRNRLNLSFLSDNEVTWVLWIAVFLGSFVLPGVLSGIARRRTFLWGILPILTVFSAAEAYGWVVVGPQSILEYFLYKLLGCAGCLGVSSGPVSLFRWLRARRRREAAFAALEAERETASVLQEGVWPPPPDYRK